MKYCGADEAKELSDMAIDIWMDYYGRFIDPDMVEYIVRRFQSESAIKQQIKDGYLYWFIMKGDKKAGYACVVPEGDSLFMSKLYVSKEVRGSGLGSKTMDDILSIGKAMGKKKVYLRVNKHNTSSIEFYRRKGFVITRSLKEDLGEGYYLDDHFMEHIL